MDTLPTLRSTPGVTLVEGSRRAISQYFTLGALQVAPLVMNAASAPGDTLVVPLGAARALLASLRTRLGNSPVESALGPHRALLSLVLRGLEPALSTDERVARENQSALFLGNLPNTGLSARPLLEAWASVLATLLPQVAAPWWIPDALALDPGSLALVRMTLRVMAPDQRPEVVLGVVTHDPAPGDLPAPMDARDALGQRVAAMVAAEVSTLRALAVTTVVAATRVPAHPGEPDTDSTVLTHPADVTLDPTDDGLERAAAAVLAAGGPCDMAGTELVYRAARASFNAFGFAATLPLADAVLATDQDPSRAAELHTLAGLAGLHVAPPRPTPGDTLVAAADAHLRTALALETDPRRRVHLGFRATIRTARGRGDLPAAVAAGEGAVALARTADLSVPWQRYMEAWCRNARAFPLFRLGRAGEAMEDCRAALALLAPSTGATETADAPPAVDVEVARFHVLNNLTRLAWEAGDRDGAHAWQARCFASEEAIPRHRRTLFRWHEHALDLDDLAAAAERLTAWHAAAVEDWEPALAAVLGHDLAAVRYRLGDAVRAQELFHDVHRGWRALGADPAECFSAQVNAAVAAYRAGRHACARAGLSACLDDPLAQDPGTRAELTAAMAMVSAAMDQASQTRVLATTAHALADTADDPGTSARVARSLGDAWRALGQADAACSAYREGLGHLDAAGDAGAPEDRLGLLLGLHSMEGVTARLVDALAITPAALADANAWWDLASLVCALARAPETFAGPAGEAHRALARTVLAMAVQRIDTTGACRALATVLADA